MVSPAKLGDALKQMGVAVKAVMAAEGTLGRDIDSRLQEALGFVQVYQHARLLMLSLFSSFIDPLGMMVRGGTVKDAYEGFVRGAREVVKGWQGKTSQDEMARFAELIGTVDASSYLDALGQSYSSLYMKGRLRNLSNLIFKVNGMEAWNRSMRISATAASIGFIEKHLKTPGEHSKRYLQDELGLTGKNYLKADGKLDTDNEQVRAAIVRWVNGAILRPNAMQRPIIASDPHYALFYSLKQFTYSFHKTILKRAWVEAQHGNYNPTTTLVAAYIPMMVMADVLKELLRPGDEPAWMKMGLGAYVQHGAGRAGLMGVPGIFTDALWDMEPIDKPERTSSKVAALLGPSVQQLVEGLTVPLSSDKDIMEYLMKSIPASTVVRDVPDWFK